MQTDCLDHKDAIAYLKRLKSDVQPNEGFEQQLMIWKVGTRLRKVSV